MPEIGKLKRVCQRGIRVVGVETTPIHPIQVETAIIHYDGDPYEGPYIVTPLAWQQQTLETKDKLMQDDVTVLEIPYFETTNPQGGSTIYIGE